MLRNRGYAVRHGVDDQIIAAGALLALTVLMTAAAFPVVAGVEAGNAAVADAGSTYLHSQMDCEGVDVECAVSGSTIAIAGATTVATAATGGSALLIAGGLAGL